MISEEGAENVAEYSELIKNLGKIREYVRDFYIFGFKTREGFEKKSSRTYDNERRRIEGWLSDFVHTEYSGHKKRVFVKIDSGRIFENPLYQCFKAKSYTGNDIRLHFILSEILEDEEMTVNEITDRIISDYEMVFDVQTVRLKLKEYVSEGLVRQYKKGNTVSYKKSDIYPEDILEKYKYFREFITFFSEEIPLGVAGNYIMDSADIRNSVFTRKHAYLVHTLDDEIMLCLIEAMENKCETVLSCKGLKKGTGYEERGVPLKIRSSVSNGRNYVILYSFVRNRLISVRVDSVLSVKILSVCNEYDTFYSYYEKNAGHIWGTSFGEKRKYGQTEHIHMEIVFDENSENYICDRLIRERRNGTVIKISEGRYAFDADVFDANEIMPWVKTFLGRIAVFESTNPELEEKLKGDTDRLMKIYGGKN